MSSTSLVLTQDQEYIVNDISKELSSSYNRFDCCINGYAGTGKSTTISRMIKRLIMDGYDIAITSPTHKANSVLRTMLANEGITPSVVDVMTIHSFLGLKLVQRKDKQVLEYDKHSPNAKKTYDILFIDECSMISTDLYMHIVKQASRIRTAIIFIGDVCQLPPVEPEAPGTTISVTFNHGQQYVLDKVLRQALDNTIISFATKVRECIGTDTNPLSLLSGIPEDDCNIVKVLGLDSVISTYLHAIEGSGNINTGVHQYKILSYTNKNVDLLNSLIRNNLVKCEKELMKDEPIVFDESTQNCPYAIQEIIKCPDIVEDIYMGVKCWKLKSDLGTIHVVGPESKKEYQKHLQNIVNDINQGTINPYTKKRWDWGDFYILKEHINVVSYPYAQTIHKSQGSTYDAVWLDLQGTRNIKNIDDLARIMYTGSTRPRNFLVINEG
jgi:exodeoxyribonuclease-5